MTVKISMDFVRNGRTVTHDAGDILRMVKADKPLTELGKLVRVTAPQRVIDLLQQLPGGEIVDDSGVVTSAATLEGFIAILIFSAAVGLGYTVGFNEGYEDAQEAGEGEGGAAGEGEGDGEGDGDGEGSGGGQDGGDGEGERVGAGRRSHRGARS
jgi:hypothetical protein